MNMSELGEYLTRSWSGFFDAKDYERRSGHIYRSSDYLLAAINNRLRASEHQSRAVSDGMLLWLNKSRPIPELSSLAGTLSVRARKVLLRGAFKFSGQVTRSSLTPVKGAGPGTINEILEWVSKYDGVNRE